MRPDGVMRSSILQPFVGFSPQADVQAVARAFTTGGPLGTDLRGFGAPSGGLWGRIKAFFAKPSQAQVAAAIANMSPGPEMVVSSQVAPQMQAQMNLLAHLTHNSNPHHLQAAVLKAHMTLVKRRPLTWYRAG